MTRLAEMLLPFLNRQFRNKDIVNRKIGHRIEDHQDLSWRSAYPNERKETRGEGE